jgi:alkanesulfonate monooxygenase SsuD/methylene tetrahydromethanopterin reductase-like flavin-dependent oxidoreductase (luciferase family)
LRPSPRPAAYPRFDEGVEAIVGPLTEPTTTLHGRYVRLTDARCEPKPIQRPHPPIVIGGRGPKRTLRAGARWAQQWNAITDNAVRWRGLTDILLAHCAEIGRDPAEITCSVNVRIDSSDDLAPAVETVSAYRDAGADLVIMNLPHRARPASLETLANALAPLA